MIGSNIVTFYNLVLRLTLIQPDLLIACDKAFLTLSPPCLSAYAKNRYRVSKVTAIKSIDIHPRAEYRARN